MGCTGVHFSLSDAEVDHLLGIGDDSRRLHYFRQKIEPVYFADHPERLAEDGVGWEPMHRVLSEGTFLSEGRYPLNHVVLGGTNLYAGDDFIMVLKARNQVHDVAKALPSVSHHDFHQHYRIVNASDYGHALSNEDFEATWRAFEGLRAFWLRAADEDRFVLFTANGKVEVKSPF